ncbi:ACP S-malonyltransferase [Frankia sp. Ag45/Mut15]|uniref:[acyl-carrier-protein] S-malonyltransferase n=1 Tax=Frankia umida TaxID=573489 RepID=A0ABT0JSW0_9ACTN|nr:ACP S-malonyltransferase [Frankia umida]MCK9874627.1 ACP S-malonyltransferase [Frankia umida]
MREIIKVGDVAMVVAQADDAASLARMLADDDAGHDRTGEPSATTTRVGGAGEVWRAVHPAWPPAAARRGDALLTRWLAQGRTAAWDTRHGVHLRRLTTRSSIGLLFPGQGSPARDSGGVLAEFLPAVAQLYQQADLDPLPPPDEPGPAVDTALAQPAIVTASLAARLALDAIGVPQGAVTVAVGHSLGELSALAWAGAVHDGDVVELARARGAIMSAHGVPGTAMASVAAAPDLVEQVRTLLIDSDDHVDHLDPEDHGSTGIRPRTWPAWVACRNGTEQTVVAGSRSGVDILVRALDVRGVRSMYLPVSHAFHTPMVEAAVEPLRRRLAHQRLGPVRRPVVSTVTGRFLGPDDDLRALLTRQITEPVYFMDAVHRAAAGVDAWVEVGPGRVLSKLAAQISGLPAVSVEAGSTSWRGLAGVVAMALALGLPVDLTAFGRPSDDPLAHPLGSAQSLGLIRPLRVGHSRVTSGKQRSTGPHLGR